MARDHGDRGGQVKPKASAHEPCNVAVAVRLLRRATNEEKTMRRTLGTAIPTGLILLFARGAFAQDSPPSTEVVLPAQEPAPPGPAVVVQPAPPEKDKHSDLASANDRQNGGTGLEWVYLNADAGFAGADLASLKSSRWDLQDTSSVGPAFGIAAGVRLLFLALGVRARDLQLSAFNLWEVNAEAAFHMKIWRIDPYFGVRGGYAFMGGMSAESLQTSTGTAASDVTVHGWNVGPMIGLDVYFSKLISVGVDANAEVLFLKRPPLALQPGQTIPPQYQGLYADSGSSVGAGFVGMAHLGIHF